MKKLKLFLGLSVLVLSLSLATNTFGQWTLTANFPSPVGSNPSISVYSPTGVVVFGGPSGTPTALRTTDGGLTPWTNISGNMTGPELFCGWAVDANLMFGGDGGANAGGGGNARVWKTTNGGTNWTVVVSTGGSAGFFNWVMFSRLTPTFGVAQSDPPTGPGGIYYLSKTTDGGATWNPFSPQPPGISGQATAQNSGEVIDPLFIAMGLGNNAPPRVDITNNGGTSWFVGTATGAGTGGFVSGLTFSTDKLRGMAGTSGISTTISRTVNGGTTWASQSYGGGPGGYCTLRWIAGTEIVYLMGSTGGGGAVKRSSDGGLTWTQMTTATLTGFTHMQYFKAPNNAIYLYAIAPDGSVIYYADLSLVGIDPNNNNVPAEYKLEQNYPNPFNPTTTLKYALPRGSNVTLKVYDMLGNEIMTVINGYQTAGNYVETIDASSLASGVYFYKLNAGDFTDSKKMTVVK